MSRFLIDSLNRAVLGEIRSIKAVLEAILGHFICDVNYLPWPDPSSVIFWKIFSLYHEAISKAKIADFNAGI